MSDFDLFPGQNCRCGNDPGCTNCGSGEAAEQAFRAEEERRRQAEPEPCPICNDRGVIPGDLVEYGSTMTSLPDTICECQDPG